MPTQFWRWRSQPNLEYRVRRKATHLDSRNHFGDLRLVGDAVRATLLVPLGGSR